MAGGSPRGPDVDATLLSLNLDRLLGGGVTMDATLVSPAAAAVAGSKGWPFPAPKAEQISGQWWSQPGTHRPLTRQ